MMVGCNPLFEAFVRTTKYLYKESTSLHHVFNVACCYYVYRRFLWLTYEACAVSGVPLCVCDLTYGMRACGLYMCTASPQV
jgi:hypothetical protein